MTAPTERTLQGQPVSRPSAIPVSFLVTSYNKAAYLPAVLDSVWREAQAVSGEVILVDDGSSDGSERICAEFAELHPEILYWRQENRGIYQTVNSIAAKARGQWVRFCDSDDPLIPGSTRRLIEIAKETGAGVVYVRAIVYGPEPLPEERLSLRISSPSATNVHPGWGDVSDPRNEFHAVHGGLPGGRVDGGPSSTGGFSLMPGPGLVVSHRQPAAARLDQ
jgi:glycosyltransferase involved in cell wall biosynthesis